MDSEEAALLPERWVSALLGCAFFTPCSTHAAGAKEGLASGKNELVNVFCLDSLKPMCPICVFARPHPRRLLQVRRSSYHDVVRVQDVAKLLDIAGIQTYMINGARVVFLNRRPQPRSNANKGTGVARHNACQQCERTLQSETSQFCSIACKVDNVGFAGVHPTSVSSPLPHGEAASGSESDASPVPSPRLARGTKRAHTDAAGVSVTPPSRNASSMRHTPSLRGSTESPSPRAISYRHANRRKGIPRRSPEC